MNQFTKYLALRMSRALTLLAARRVSRLKLAILAVASPGDTVIVHAHGLSRSMWDQFNIQAQQIAESFGVKICIVSDVRHQRIEVTRRLPPVTR